MAEVDFLDQMFIEIWEMFAEMFPTFDSSKIVRGYQNTQPLPIDGIVITFITETDLDQLSYSEVTNPDLISQTVTVQTAVKTMMQVDCYGELGQARARQIATMFKNPYACDRLQSCQPLDYRPPKNLSFVNEASEYEARWMVEIDMQYNPHYTYRQESTTVMPSVDIQPPL